MRSHFHYVLCLSEAKGMDINMGNMTGNCTDTKAGITVKTVFDGKQSGQQAFMKLIPK